VSRPWRTTRPPAPVTIRSIDTGEVVAVKAQRDLEPAATPRRVGYLRKLREELGVPDTPLPDDVTRREVKAEIDRLEARRKSIQRGRVLSAIRKHGRA
jgi:hypothetical protein